MDEAEEIKTNIQSPDTLVICVSSVKEALLYVKRIECSLIILDAAIFVQNDNKLSSALRANKATPILVLSAKFDSVERLHSLRGGAHAYIGKPYLLEECLAQTHALMQLYCELRAASKMRHTLSFGGNLIIEPLSRQVLLNGKDLYLTRKEFDLLLCLASNPEQVFTRKQLYDHVWDEKSTYNVDEAVKAQIKTLRQKLSITGKKYIKMCGALDTVFT